MARVVVMRSERGFYGWGDRGLPVKVDERSIGEITTGNCVSSDIAPGKHQVSRLIYGISSASPVTISMLRRVEPTS